MTTATARKTTEEVIKSLPAPPKGSLFAVTDVITINARPHPYMIGPKHLDYSNMILDDYSIKRAEDHGVRCYWKGTNGRKGPRCTLRYDEHTSDKVAVVKVQGEQELNDTPGLRDYLKAVVDSGVLAEAKIDGFIFTK